VNLTFDENLDSSRATSPGSYLIESLEERPDTVDLSSVGLVAVSIPWGRPNQVVLSTTPLTGGRDYRVTVTGLTDRVGNIIRPDGRQAVMSGVDGPDSIGPVLEYLWPPDSSDQVFSQSSMTLYFDEAVKPTSMESAFSLTDTSGLSVGGHFQFLHGAAAAFVSQQPLASDRWYELSFQGSEVRDLAGHPMGDSTVVSHFRTIDEQLLGSISGTVDRGSYSPEAPAIIFVLGPQERSRFIRHPVPGRQYRLDPLLPGAYALRAFLDLNGDGHWSSGRPVPFQPAEPLWVGTDSVSVRSRWAPAGVDVSF
jgi:hypothetical protein